MRDRKTLNMTWWVSLLTLIGLVVGGIMCCVQFEWMVSSRVHDIDTLKSTVARAEESAARAEQAAAQAQRATSEVGGDVKAIRATLDEFRLERIRSEKNQKP